MAAASHSEGRPRPIRRIWFFAARFDWMGPAIIVLSIWYLATQVLVARVFRPHYSFISNVISDLGNTGCPPPHSNICSPGHVWMNIAIILLGLAMMVGSVLIFSEFSLREDSREHRAAMAGFWCLGLGGAGAILVGLFPENVNTAHLHTVGTAMAISLGQLAILILVLLRELDKRMRWFMLIASLIVLLAGICIVLKLHFGIGQGALERLAQYPETLWLIVFGVYISQSHLRKGVIRRNLRFNDGQLTSRRAWIAAAQPLSPSLSYNGGAGRFGAVAGPPPGPPFGEGDDDK